MKKRKFFLVDSEKESELEFELIKCIFKKNNSEGFEKFIENISEVEFNIKNDENSKDKTKNFQPYKNLEDKFFLNICELRRKFDEKSEFSKYVEKNFYDIIFKEICKMNEKFKKENNYHNDDFLEYSHEEIACLITGCDLYEKILKIIEYQYPTIPMFCYIVVYNNMFPELKLLNFLEEKFNFNPKYINISIENIENYKNNPEKLEEDFKNFCKNYKNNHIENEIIKNAIILYITKHYNSKNNSEVTTNEDEEKLIEIMSIIITKTMVFISKSEPKNHTPSSIYCLCNNIIFYTNLNRFFNNQSEELNKEFYENFKNKKFYKTIIENGKIQLTNCITGKIIKNQEELEKDIENQEEPEQNQNKEPEVSLVKN